MHVLVQACIKRNCGWLIKSVMVPWNELPYMDNCGNSRANTCYQAPTTLEGVLLLGTKTNRA